MKKRIATIMLVAMLTMILSVALVACKSSASIVREAQDKMNALDNFTRTANSKSTFIESIGGKENKDILETSQITKFDEKNGVMSQSNTRNYNEIVEGKETVSQDKYSSVLKDNIYYQKSEDVQDNVAGTPRYNARYQVLPIVSFDFKSNINNIAGLSGSMTNGLIELGDFNIEKKKVNKMIKETAPLKLSQEGIDAKMTLLDGAALTILYTSKGFISEISYAYTISPEENEGVKMKLNVEGKETFNEINTTIPDALTDADKYTLKKADAFNVDYDAIKEASILAKEAVGGSTQEEMFSISNEKRKLVTKINGAVKSTEIYAFAKMNEKENYYTFSDFEGTRTYNTSRVSPEFTGWECNRFLGWDNEESEGKIVIVESVKDKLVFKYTNGDEVCTITLGRNGLHLLEYSKGSGTSKITQSIFVTYEPQTIELPSNYMTYTAQ